MIILISSGDFYSISTINHSPLIKHYQSIDVNIE